MQQTYLTVKNKSSSLFKDKGSKFIGFCEPCQDELDIKSILNTWKTLHPQATHICYAFKFGVNEVKYRANDDGEPSNSAGAPILGQINSFQLTNVFVGVVRYYGGTNLGVSGLINAYKTAAKLAIEENQIIQKELCTILEFQFEMIHLPIVMQIIKTKGCEINSKELNQICNIQITIENTYLESILNALNSIEKLQITKKIGQK